MESSTWDAIMEVGFAPERLIVCEMGFGGGWEWYDSNDDGSAVVSTADDGGVMCQVYQPGNGTENHKEWNGKRMNKHRQGRSRS